MSVQCVMSSCGCAHIVVFGMRLSPMYYQFWNQCTLFNPILCDINLLTALIIQVMHGMGTAFVLIGYYCEVTLQLIISVMKFLEWCSCSSLR